MNLKNCSECGNLYVENPSGLCPNCLREEDKAEDIVAEFLRNTKQASLEEIHEATGIKTKVILRMLKRGRITSDTQISYPCTTCGAPIFEGRLCDRCAKNITDQIKPKTEDWQPPKKEEQATKDDRMYIKDFFKK